MQDPIERTLVLFRHAKAVPSESGPDIERPLSPRGRADAGAAGRWLSSQGIVADVVLCSPSERTRETWQYAAAAGATADDVWFDRRIYNAYPEVLLEVLHDVPSEARTVVMVGHAPGIPSLAETLAVPGDTADHRRMAEKYPTSGLAVLRHDAAWEDLGENDADLVTFTVPRG